MTLKDSFNYTEPGLANKNVLKLGQFRALKMCTICLHQHNCMFLLILFCHYSIHFDATAENQECSRVDLVLLFY